MVEICPSILSADFWRLGEQVRITEENGCRILHYDVMDGDFVPSISFGMPVLRTIRKETKMFLDVHMMVREPIRYVRDFADCGADSITVHLEACSDVDATLKAIRDCGIQAGISVKPATPVEEAFPYLDRCGIFLVMTVEPGFGGQSYIESSTEKIRKAKAFIDERGLDCRIQVDGGINEKTIPIVVPAGAALLVQGSDIFRGDIAENVRRSKERIRFAQSQQ